MAASKPISRPAAHTRVVQALTRAENIIAMLKNRSPVPASLVSEVEATIKRTFPLPHTPSLADKAAALDAMGSEIWNAATNLLRDDSKQLDPTIEGKSTASLAASLRAFAFFLLDAAHHSWSKHSRDYDRRVRTFKIGLKACRLCMDYDYLDFALKGLERCSDYVTAIEEAEPILHIAPSADNDNHVDRQLASQRLVCEYHLLRTMHAWKSDRLDLAQYFYLKVDNDDLSRSTDLAEKAADLFHEVGKSLASRNMTEPAMAWYERAIKALDACGIGSQSIDAVDLRLSLTTDLVQALLTLNDTASLERAATLVRALEEDYGLGNRIAVSLMHINVLTHASPVDVEQMDRVLGHMLRVTVITEHTFKIIMKTMNKAGRYSARCAQSTLRDFIDRRLLPDVVHGPDSDTSTVDRLEKAVVTFVLFATSQEELASCTQIEAMCDLFDTLIKNPKATLSTKAIHAAQTLIWKAAGALSAKGSDDWYSALRHPLFDAAGPLNKARIARKSVAAALARDDLSGAREAFFQMPVVTQNENISRYLAFKLAVRSSDSDLAYESLAVISKHSHKDPKFLYACVLEAQQSDMRALAVAALQALLDKQPPGVHLPSLLRCTVRLLTGELDPQRLDHDQVMGEILQAFEHASANIKLLRQASNEQWRVEIQWWSKNAYNLALRVCAYAQPAYLVRLLTACIRFLDAYPTDDDYIHGKDITSRKMVCHFLAATSLIVLARSSEEGSEDALQSYLNARQQIAAFLHLATTAIDATENEIHLARKLELLKFELECILRLRQWDELDQAFRLLLDFEKIDRWDSLADLLLVIHEQIVNLDAASSAHGRITELLQRCINETWRKDRDITKMSRWLRLAFSIYLEDDETGLALKIVQQAASIAKRGYNARTDLYPGDELQWLSTSAFNKAVDILSTGNRDAITAWTDASLELARYAEDNGALHAHLTHKCKLAEERMQAMAM